MLHCTARLKPVAVHLHCTVAIGCVSNLKGKVTGDRSYMKLLPTIAIHCKQQMTPKVETNKKKHARPRRPQAAARRRRSANDCPTCSLPCSTRGSAPALAFGSSESMVTSGQMRRTKSCTTPRSQCQSKNYEKCAKRMRRTTKKCPTLYRTLLHCAARPNFVTVHCCVRAQSRCHASPQLKS